MATEKDDIELLLARVEQMRQHQKDFFARKHKTDKRLAIEKEKRSMSCAGS